jgi:hypothetical protein
LPTVPSPTTTSFILRGSLDIKEIIIDLLRIKKKRISMRFSPGFDMHIQL